MWDWQRRFAVKQRVVPQCIIGSLHSSKILLPVLFFQIKIHGIGRDALLLRRE